MSKYFSLRAGGNHYLSMALNTVTNDLQREQVKLKRYFYALRSALACKWITERQTVPPMELEMLRVLVDDRSFQFSVDELLKMKLVNDEKTLIKPVPVLDDWLKSTLSACKISLGSIPSKHHPADELNAIFRKYISS